MPHFNGRKNKIKIIKNNNIKNNNIKNNNIKNNIKTIQNKLLYNE